MTLQKDPEGMEIRYLNQKAVFSDKHVLEIGSGDGRLTWRVAPSAGHVTGIDLDADALHAAATDCPANLRDKVWFAQAGSQDLPFPHETFNIAMLAWSF
jgi:ubiquinone/menaquinone biosynthesis C-methylase UbiE